MRRAKDYRSIPPSAIKIDLPNTTQLPSYTCGASALLSVCAYFGVGPEEEKQIVLDMQMTRAGADPAHIVRAARKYGLEIEDHRPMSDEELRRSLDRGRPVILMLQAWSRERVRYDDHWDDGHWVVAIGYDDDHFYFEDPSVHTSRAFLSRADLARRWHDYDGPRGKKNRAHRVGLSVWRPGFSRTAYRRSARRID